MSFKEEKNDYGLVINYCIEINTKWQNVSLFRWMLVGDLFVGNIQGNARQKVDLKLIVRGIPLTTLMRTKFLRHKMLKELWKRDAREFYRKDCV